MNKFETDCLFSRNGKTVSYGTKSISALAPKIWNLVPPQIRNSQFSYQFKEKMCTWSTKRYLVAFAKHTFKSGFTLIMF